MHALKKSFPAETFSFGKSWTRLVGAMYNPSGEARSLGMALTNILVDHSLCLALYAYSMTAAVGHFSLSSSDTTVLDWNNHDH